MSRLAQFVYRGIIILSVMYGESAAIHCFQCDSQHSRYCSENLPENIYGPVNESEYGQWIHRAESCAHVYDAKYCIKTTGIYGGVMGAKRFCSSKDYGNFCELVDRPGDERNYYACVYTCSGDGCNGTSSAKLTFSVILASLLAIIACSL